MNESFQSETELQVSDVLARVVKGIEWQVLLKPENL